MPRILIVDDERAVLRMLTVAFSKTGYEVRTAVHAQEAMELLDRESVDAVLSDVLLNHLSGHDLVRWIAARGKTVPCALMTGFDPEDCGDCPFSDRCAVLAKPLNPKDAVVPIDRLIKQAESPAH